MMEKAHPDELELLTHVDERPRSSRAREVAAHVADCEACAATVRDLQAARTALRAAPRLELPPARRAAISSALAAHAPARRSSLWRGRVAALLAPVAVVAVVVVAVDAVRERGGDTPVGGDAAAPTELRPAEEGAGEEGAGAAAPEAGADAGAEASALAAPVVRVAGPPADVLRLLRAEGLTARTSGGRVVVSDATQDQVREALRGRRRGRVPVVLE
jgi:hypothetical protein